uniref:Putative secreted protein n=1 Tax=Anopheles marajoara TaxID=58244 RepID=A0A2M4C7E4_9DIPT
MNSKLSQFSMTKHSTWASHAGAGTVLLSLSGTLADLATPRGCGFSGVKRRSHSDREKRKTQPSALVARITGCICHALLRPFSNCSTTSSTLTRGSLRTHESIVVNHHSLGRARQRE